MAYCLPITRRARLKPLAPGLTSRAVLDKFAAIQMLDVHFPSTDGLTLILSRYTEPNPDQRLLLEPLDLTAQPPPRITAAGPRAGRHGPGGEAIPRPSLRYPGMRPSQHLLHRIAAFIMQVAGETL